MGGTHSRRRVVATSSLLVGGIAGCSTLFGERRIIGFSVINHTDESLNALLRTYKDEEIFAEQGVDLPEECPGDDGGNAGSSTRVTLNDVSNGTELTAEITVNENRTESVDFAIDCDVDGDWSGDGVSFRIYDEYIDATAGCTSSRPV